MLEERRRTPAHTLRLLGLLCFADDVNDELDISRMQHPDLRIVDGHSDSCKQGLTSCGLARRVLDDEWTQGRTVAILASSELLKAQGPGTSTLAPSITNSNAKMLVSYASPHDGEGGMKHLCSGVQNSHSALFLTPAPSCGRARKKSSPMLWVCGIRRCWVLFAMSCSTPSKKGSLAVIMQLSMSSKEERTPAQAVVTSSLENANPDPTRPGSNPYPQRVSQPLSRFFIVSYPQIANALPTLENWRVASLNECRRRLLAYLYEYMAFEGFYTLFTSVALKPVYVKHSGQIPGEMVDTAVFDHMFCWFFGKFWNLRTSKIMSGREPASAGSHQVQCSRVNFIHDVLVNRTSGS
ncbi:hypothetical protein FA15DRAFT_660966 [Coprinopsis marcescibilis]|uniref:Uncharacterized protein n=1 Tax=Coprinopsis marcescibilis TaxID=230819 RepID=A0A5C3KDQ1_COPMA|nr:hypothetical protein FA15DRAFT_660966 [Coprinopsis marcescibilis]